MGNVVVSEALRQQVKIPSSPLEIVHTYIATQAASVAHAYDATIAENDKATLNLEDIVIYPQTPEVFANYPMSGKPYFADIGNAVRGKRIVNFFNLQDYALSNFSWGFNQALKPDLFYGYTWEPDSKSFRKGISFLFKIDIKLKTELPKSTDKKVFLPERFRQQFEQRGISLSDKEHVFVVRLPFDKSWRIRDELRERVYQVHPNIGMGVLNIQEVISLRFPQDRYKIFSKIVEARSRALGAQAGLSSHPKGPIKTELNLNLNFGFGAESYEHSAQFLSNNMQRHPYWKALLCEFDLGGSGVVVPLECGK